MAAVSIGCGRMKSASTRLSRFERGGVWRLALTALLLFAFGLQSYVTQTHFHAPAAASALQLQSGQTGRESSQAASPLHDEATACPFCQAISTAGAYFNSTAVSLAAPLKQASTADIPPVAVGPSNVARGFDWRSRAPPQA